MFSIFCWHLLHNLCWTWLFKRAKKNNKQVDLGKVKYELFYESCNGLQTGPVSICTAADVQVI